MKGRVVRRRALACAVIVLSLAAGCASTGNGGDPRDPFEPVNRAIYRFNEKFDDVLAKPVAEAYRDYVPSPIRTGVGNFFSNLGDVVIGVNDLMQGKMPEAINDFGRVMVNTTLGVLGFWDRATELGVEKRNEDFGQTLGWWGLGDGPYLVLPILGPSSVRDTFGWAGDIYAWPATYVDPTAARNSLAATRFVHTRADLLEASRILDTAALDPYTFVRDAYLQRRRNLVYDGNPPPEEEFFDEPEPKKAPSVSDAGNGSSAGSGIPAGTSGEAITPGPQSRTGGEDTVRDPALRKSSVVRLWLSGSTSGE